LVGFFAAFAFKKPKANQRGGKPIGDLGQSFSTKLTTPFPMLLPVVRWATSKNLPVVTGYEDTGSFFSPPPPLTFHVGLPTATPGLPSTTPSMEAWARWAAGDEHARPGYELRARARAHQRQRALRVGDPPSLLQ
jgi:hypothetical protein